MTNWINTLDELHAIYGTPKASSLVKVADRVTPEYRAWIEAAPLCALATVGPEGTDCSPRGDRGSVVHIEDEKTLHLPDRIGNNRIDTLRNIVRDPRLSLMFLVPGSDTVIRINGTGRICVEPALLARHETQGKPPRSVLVVTIDELYFQCSRALMRAEAWSARPDISDLPTPGAILKAMSEGREGGEDYDRAWPERARNSMW